MTQPRYVLRLQGYSPLRYHFDTRHGRTLVEGQTGADYDLDPMGRLSKVKKRKKAQKAKRQRIEAARRKHQG
jgi:hypothetical protein